MIFTFFKTFLFLFSLSLILYAIFPLTFFDLIKMDAGFLGISLIFAYFWPSVRGVRKGDEVSVVTGNLPRLFGIVGKALTNAKKGEKIKVLLDSGKEVVGVVESYSNIFSKPKVRLLYQEEEKEILE